MNEVLERITSEEKSILLKACDEAIDLDSLNRCELTSVMWLLHWKLLASLETLDGGLEFRATGQGNRLRRQIRTTYAPSSGRRLLEVV